MIGGLTPWRSASAIAAGRRRARAGGALLVGLLFALYLATAGSAARAPARRVALGVYIHEALQRPARIDAYVREMGRKPVIISEYIRWPGAPFAPAALSAAGKRGAVPMISWEPWTSAEGGFALKDIAAGRYDAYIGAAARAAAAWGHPILLRFAHEMNGNWYPWGSGRAGNTAELYKSAWRHLVEIFRRHGARNVQWVWAPNENGSGRYPFQQLYPGDRWVDWVGLDGFNGVPGSSWTSFTSLFAKSYNMLIRLSSRPVIITETGSAQTGGDKAAWVASALRREIPRFTGIRAVVWFDAPFGRIDARVDSSRAALRAFRAGVKSPTYTLTPAQLLALPRPVQRRPRAPAAPRAGFGSPPRTR